MSAPRGTTPTLTLTFTEKGLDLTTATNVYVTFKYGSQLMTKTGDALNISEKQITVTLSQPETLAFPEGSIYIQANWTGPGGFRAASEVVALNWSKQLLNQVVE